MATGKTLKVSVLKVNISARKQESLHNYFHLLLLKSHIFHP